jgi:pimeloyl-ACP methyl ester carboxylesterase
MDLMPTTTSPQIRFRTVDGLRIRYAESDGSNDTVTIINGHNDRVVPVANAEFLDERLPNSRVVLIDAGHFVWEEAPAEYASAVLQAIGGAPS